MQFHLESVEPKLLADVLLCRKLVPHAPIGLCEAS